MNTPEFESYIEGIEHAIPKELEACEFYGTYTLPAAIRLSECIFEALTDENEHAVYLNYLYTRTKTDSIIT